MNVISENDQDHTKESISDEQQSSILEKRKETEQTTTSSEIIVPIFIDVNENKTEESMEIKNKVCRLCMLTVIG